MSQLEDCIIIVNSQSHSKSSLELTNKDIKCVSTFIVKADVHRTDTASLEPVLTPISNKIHSIKRCPKGELDLSKVDDIHVIASENLTLPLTTKQQDKPRQKPRWSLRIKLHSSEDNDSYNGNGNCKSYCKTANFSFNTIHMMLSMARASRYLSVDGDDMFFHTLIADFVRNPLTNNCSVSMLTLLN